MTAHHAPPVLADVVQLGGQSRGEVRIGRGKPDDIGVQTRLLARCVGHALVQNLQEGVRRGAGGGWPCQRLDHGGDIGLRLGRIGGQSAPSAPGSRTCRTCAPPA